MGQLKKELLDLSEKFYERFTARVDGLTDEEYLWEPAPDAWSLVRQDGKLQMQWGLVFDEPQPVTTIAWRYTHISDMLCEERCARWLGVAEEPENYLAEGAPGDAQGARELFEKAYARWRRYLSAADDDGFFEPLGPGSRDWTNEPRTKGVLHILDEVIHHGAEIGVLRDIYRAQRDHDPVVTALLRGDEVASEAVDVARREHPDLVLRAAATAYWDAIPRLIELGFGVEGRNGRTPLHHAAAEGRVDLIKLLIAAGADTDAKDPVYQATPVVWAEFFDRRDAADLLRSSVTSR
jgi:hypothetical protein